jgi:CheY-like chemotaxis protein
VLLVAGDAQVLSACAAKLEDAGIGAATARTGFEAIVKACWHVPDMVIMQDGLSAGEGVDGGAAAQMLRLCPVTSHIPIVNADTIDRVQACDTPSREAALLAQVARELSAR